MSEFYTAKEASTLLGLEYATFLARAHAGKYKFIKIGWAIVFPKKEIDKYVNN